MANVAAWFAKGFAEVEFTGRFSAADARRLYPDASGDEIEAYLNGQDDGIAGDTFRLRLGQKKN